MSTVTPTERNIETIGVELDGGSLDLTQLAAVAYRQDDIKVTLSAEAMERVKRSRQWVEKVVRGEVRGPDGREVKIYAINTGFGSLARVSLHSKDSHILQRNLILSHSAGVGAPAPMEVVRAIMLLRANTLAKGASGVRLRLLQTLVDMINKDVVPSIPSQGSVGSSGDLAPLSHMALVLCRDPGPEDLVEESGQAWYGGELLSGKEAMARAGIERLVLEAKEGLALNNGAQMSAAYGALTLERSRRLLDRADLAAAMSLEALYGHRRAFHPLVHALRPLEGQRVCAARMLELLEGSTLADADKASVQDAYSLRCTPQIHGAARDAWRFAATQIGIEMNSVTDNPLILTELEGQETNLAYSAGNFHGEPVGIAMDLLKMVLVELGNIADRRLFRLLTGHLNKGLPHLLRVSPDETSFGLMACQMTSASLVSESKGLAMPSTVDSIPTCEDVEDLVAMSTTAARNAWRVLDNVERINALEILCAARALALRRREMGSAFHTGKGTSGAFRAVEEAVGDLLRPREPAWMMDRVMELVRGGELDGGLD